MNNFRENNTDVSLIRKLMDDDREAFTALFNRYYAHLCALIQRYIKEPEVRENLIQDLFVNIWVKRKTVKIKGSDKAYLYRAAQNKAIDYLRHQKLERTHLEQQKIEYHAEQELNITGHIHQDSRVELKSNDKLIEEVQKAVNELPERRQLIFILSREEGLSYSEIADVLDLSVKTVETQMGKALKTLRKQLSHYFITSTKE